MVARLTPDRKAACSNHVGVSIPIFFHRKQLNDSPMKQIWCLDAVILKPCSHQCGFVWKVYIFMRFGLATTLKELSYEASGHWEQVNCGLICFPWERRVRMMYILYGIAQILIVFTTAGIIKPSFHTIVFPSAVSWQMCQEIQVVSLVCWGKTFLEKSDYHAYSQCQAGPDPFLLLLGLTPVFRSQTGMNFTFETDNPHIRCKPQPLARSN